MFAADDDAVSAQHSAVTFMFMLPISARFSSHLRLANKQCSCFKWARGALQCQSSLIGHSDTENICPALLSQMACPESNLCQMLWEISTSSLIL